MTRQRSNKRFVMWSLNEDALYAFGKEGVHISWYDITCTKSGLQMADFLLSSQILTKKINNE